MPHLSELHGAATHLAVLAIPLYALLVGARRFGFSAPATVAWEPWILAAAVLGVASSGLTGLLVRGQSETQLRGSDYGIGGIHFWLGIGIAVLVLGVVAQRLLADGRRPPGLAIVGVGGLALAAVLVQGYLGGRMTYEHGGGVQSLGQAAQSARGTANLEVALAKGASPAAAGREAFSEDGLGCAACHGDHAQGQRGPSLAGGRDLEDFRRVHGHGLFPRPVVTDDDFAAINAYLQTLDHGRPDFERDDG